jgi:hypothetical protein
MIAMQASDITSALGPMNDMAVIAAPAARGMAVNEITASYRAPEARRPEKIFIQQIRAGVHAANVPEHTLAVALRAKANSVRSNPDRCASKGGHFQPCGPGGGRSVAEADGRPAGLEVQTRYLVAARTYSPR